MRSSRKIIIIGLIIGITLFGYSQYVLVSQINVIIIQNQLLEETEKGSIHDIKLEFNNPSFLFLTAGETEFFIIANEDVIGIGKLGPFVLPPLGKETASGKYLKDSKTNSPDDSIVKINGVTKYNVIFTSIDVPFVFYPTPEQAREFIRQN